MTIKLTSDFKWIESGTVMDCSKAIGISLVRRGFAKFVVDEETSETVKDTPVETVVDTQVENQTTEKKRRGRKRKKEQEIKNG